MTSAMLLEGVTLSLHLKYLTNTCKCMRNSPTIARFLKCNDGKLDEAEDFKCVVYCVFESK